jgi:hypothetical protein
MTFQAYLDTIRAKTGLGPDDFCRLAAEKGFLDAATKPATIIAWVKEDYGLGQGHAMAIVGVLGRNRGAGMSNRDKIDAQFSGAKAHWRPTFEALLGEAEKFGPVTLASTTSYVSLLKGRAKFAIVAVTADRMDVGVKLKGAAPVGRFEASGSWNSMVTHRVRVTAADQVDAELLDWLRLAYAAA